MGFGFMDLRRLGIYLGFRGLGLRGVWVCIQGLGLPAWDVLAAEERLLRV